MYLFSVYIAPSNLYITVDPANLPFLMKNMQDIATTLFQKRDGVLMVECSLICTVGLIIKSLHVS